MAVGARGCVDNDRNEEEGGRGLVKGAGEGREEGAVNEDQRNRVPTRPLTFPIMLPFLHLPLHLGPFMLPVNEHVRTEWRRRHEKLLMKCQLQRMTVVCETSDTYSNERYLFKKQ